MIVVRVELWSEVDNSRRELARMRISNDGETSAANPDRGSYAGQTLKGRSTQALDQDEVARRGRVPNFPRKNTHVWALVARMLADMGYR